MPVAPSPYPSCCDGHPCPSSSAVRAVPPHGEVWQHLWLVSITALQPHPPLALYDSRVSMLSPFSCASIVHNIFYEYWAPAATSPHCTPQAHRSPSKRTRGHRHILACLKSSLTRDLGGKKRFWWFQRRRGRGCTPQHASSRQTIYTLFHTTCWQLLAPHRHETDH